MRLKPRPSLAALAVVLTLAAAPTFTRDGSRAADASEPIRVGLLLDLSGLTSGFGVSTRQGVEVAAEQINAAGGVRGRQVVLFVRDDEGRPEKAATAVASLINRDKVGAVIGEVVSANSLAAAPRAQEAGVPMITPSSTNPRVTEVGDYIFRACFTDPFQGEVLAKFAARTLKTRRATPSSPA